MKMTFRRVLFLSLALYTIIAAEISLSAQEVLSDIRQARVLVTGPEHNRPEPFPGLGKFIGWPGGIERLSNGQLLMTNSAGYWHVSFAQPRDIEPTRKESWFKGGWPLDFPAPTGGRSMMTRSHDGGKTWTRPETLLDHRLDDGPHALFRCRDGSLLSFITVQASWYGYETAPEKYRDESNIRTRFEQVEFERHRSSSPRGDDR